MCTTNFPWKMQFWNAYTNNQFKKVQEEISRMVYSYIVEEQVDQLSGIDKISMHERSIRNAHYVRNFTFAMEYKLDGQYFSCNWRKFEFTRLLCSHICVVVSRKNVQNIDNRYILRRWKKDVYRRHSSIFFFFFYCTRISTHDGRVQKVPKC